MVAVVTLMSISFFSCDKDGDKDDEPKGYLITAEVEGGNSKITSVKALIDGNHVLATAKYSDNKFTIGLPDPSSSYLDEIYDELEGCILEAFYAYDDDDDIIGAIVYGNVSSYEITVGLYLYVTEDVDFYDSEDGVVFDLSLKEGWNLVYGISGDEDFETGTITSKKQSGLRWIFSSETRSTSGQLRSLLSNKLKAYTNH
jgi:hypothetical protein